MTSAEALRLVREAFHRDVWRRVDQMTFICRLHGLSDPRWFKRRYPNFRVELEAEFRGAENRFFDLSQVCRPADRLPFNARQDLGAAIGHTAGLDRVEFG